MQVPKISDPNLAPTSNRQEFHPTLPSLPLYILKGIAIGGIMIAAAAIYEIALSLWEIASHKFQRFDIQKFETKLKEKFNDKIITRLINLDKIDKSLLFKRLVICKKEEEEILNTLMTKFDLSDTQLQEILMGAHVRLEDNGQYYKEWVNKISDEAKKARISSHPSNATQYGVRGPLVKELLFSQAEENGTTYTWFQLENHPVSFGHVLRHTLDYFKYKLTGKQQGPYGSSYATDRKPIIAKLRSAEESDPSNRV